MRRQWHQAETCRARMNKLHPGMLAGVPIHGWGCCTVGKSLLGPSPSANLQGSGCCLLSQTWLTDTKWTLTARGVGCLIIVDTWPVTLFILSSVSSLASTRAGAPDAVVSVSASWRRGKGLPDSRSSIKYSRRTRRTLASCRKQIRSRGSARP